MRAGIATALLAFAATCAQAGGPLSVCGNGIAVKYPGAGTVNLNYDQGPLGTRTKAQADTIVTNAVALWTNVGTATVTIGRGADLPVDVTTANLSTYRNVSNDGLNPVIYDDDGSITDFIFGVGSKNSVLGFAGSAFSLGTCQFTEGQAVINGSRNVTDAVLGVVLAHEVGHLIGLDHTQLDSTQNLASTNYPLMYPIAFRTSLSLHDDDVASVSALYPGATLNGIYGQISGTFVLADGVTAVKGANLWATETTSGKVYSIVSDYLLQNSGFFKLLLPPGNYNLRAEPIDSTFDGGSSVGPYSDVFPTSLSFQPPMYVGGAPIAPITLGNATPTAFNISAGCAATLTFRINGTGTVGGNCSGASTFVMNVGTSGTGTGTVTSAPGGINCGLACSSVYANGTTVVLTATPAGGSIFGGWSGACTGTGTCSVVMNSPINVTASFLPAAAAAEVFPPGCLLPVGWTVPGTANSGWSVASNDSTEGICSLKSNAIGDSQKAQIQFTGNFAAGNITFNRRVSSEDGFDCFRFLVDNVQQAVGGACAGVGGPGGIGASGVVAWGPVSVPITAGAHTIIWSYEKDINTIGGEDAAYIDAVVLPIAAPPGVLQFTASTLSVSESAGNAVVSVSRTGGSGGAASVNFVTSGATATAGTDFTGQAGTLNWANGDSANKTITVPIVNDTLVEGNETFTVALTSPAGATLGATTTITVTIVDDDVATVPGAPTIGAATPGNAQATIAFTAPASNGGSPITSYSVVCTAGGQPTGTGGGAISPLTVTGLTNGALYTCAAFAINGIGTSAASATVTVTPSALVLTGVVSRKTHTGVGAFDIIVDSSLPITGPISVEPRVIGAGHTVHFQFSSAINNAGTLSVLDAASLPIGATNGISGNDVIVTIPALADNKRITISLTGVNGILNPPAASIGFLVGDVDNTRSVNSSDISAVKARSGQTTTALNFRFDVNASGTVNSSDISAVKARSGLTLP